LTLNDYLQCATANNAGLKAAFEQWNVAIEEVPQAKALPDPQFSYEYWTRQSDLQMKQTVGIMQTFPWFGKIDARTEAAYRSDMVDFLSLIDAQRMLLDYYLSYERALVDNRQKLAELEMLMGTELDSIQK
jgi:outer membrane protein TolC